MSEDISEDIKTILKKKNIIYRKVIGLLEEKAQEEYKKRETDKIGGNINNFAVSATNNKSHMTLKQAMDNSFDRIRKYSKRNI